MAFISRTRGVGSINLSRWLRSCSPVFLTWGTHRPFTRY